MRRSWKGIGTTQPACRSGKEAAWDLYVELLTRITTQPLPDEDGVEQTALDSIYALFGITRETLKAHGRSCIQFAKIAIVVLEQVVRPFTAKWPAKPKRCLLLLKSASNSAKDTANPCYAH